MHFLKTKTVLVLIALFSSFVGCSALLSDSTFPENHLYKHWVCYSGNRQDTIAYIPFDAKAAENLDPFFKYGGITFQRDHTYKKHHWKMCGNDTGPDNYVFPWSLQKIKDRYQISMKNIDGQINTFIILELEEDWLLMIPAPVAHKVQIEWRKSITGDFSFKDKWSYPSGVHKNRFGQLSGGEFCPTQINAMTDKFGKIYQDSLARYYQLVDTSHLFHSISCEARCYEWDGTDFISLTTSGDTLKAFTHTTISTHSSLRLVIVNDTCAPTIELNSVAASMGNRTYVCKDGRMLIDESFWKQGVLKAEFDFQFYHEENPKIAFYWRGKIFAKTDTN